LLPGCERLLKNLDGKFESNLNFTQQRTELFEPVRAESELLAIEFEGGIVFLHESQDKKLLDLSRNRLENECRQRVAALRRTATARGLMIRQKEPHEEIALLPVYKFIQFIQFTMQPQSLLRMVLLGAVRKLSPFDQRFHRQLLHTATRFEFRTFLCSNLVD